jgi:hypothetical protein
VAPRRVLPAEPCSALLSPPHHNTTQPYVSASPQATHRKPRGSGEPRKELPVRECRSRRVQLGVRAAGDGRIPIGTGRGRWRSWRYMRRGEGREGRLIPSIATAQ